MRRATLDAYYESDEYRNKLRARLEIFQEIERDPLKITQLAVDEWALNPITFIEQFGWVLNPKYDNQVKPMFLFDYQKDIIKRIWETELSGIETDLLIDKPREMGLTWLMIWYQVWRWLFTKNWSSLNVSRTEAEVDDGSADPSASIFGKFRWAISMLPEFMMPEGFQPKGKKGTPTDMSLRITNPQMQSSIRGSTTNENIGRGGRHSFLFIDECFFIQNFQSVRRSMTSLSNVRVYVSTSKAGKVFRDFKELIQKNGNYISLTWQQNPFKDQEWYDEKVKEAEFDPEAMKEIEVGYAISTASQYYPEIVESKCAPVTYDRKLPLFISLDYGKQDHTVLVWWQVIGSQFNILECIARNKVDFDWFVPFLNPSSQPFQEKYQGMYKVLLEKTRGWSKPLAYFGEPAHKQVHYPSNSSIQKELAKYGVNLRVNDNAIRHEVRRKAVSMILPRCIFNSESDGVMELYDAIQNSRYAGSAKGVSKEATMKPAHDDEIGDYRSAFENGAVNIPRMMRQNREGLDRNEMSPLFKSMLGLLKV